MISKDSCIFCKIIKGEAPSWKVYENEFVFAFLDINPVSRYHTLVIPKNHFENIFDTPDDTIREVISVEEKLGIMNIQIINSNGQEAQQDVFHIHYHIVPRTSGDGQNVKWKTHPEWKSEFDDMILKLKE